ncbi:MAG: hypothetical protein AAF393_08055 [Pseudomonadota bacterium]
MAHPDHLVKYVCKGGETMQSLSKKHDFSRPMFWLKQKENKAAFAHFNNTRGQPFPKGLVVYLPDVKGKNVKYYKFKGPKGDMYLNERDWKAVQNELASVMIKAYNKLHTAWEMAEMRYDGQAKVNKEFPIVTFMCSTWVGSQGREPIKSRKAATNALSKLSSVVDARKYDRFEKEMRATEKAINTYRTEVIQWQDKLIGSAGNWVSGLSLTRDVSFVVFAAAATTVAAPAGAVAVVTTGMKVGAGVAFMKEGANQAGRKIAGYDVTLKGAGGDIAKAMLTGAIAGGLGAGIGKWVGGHVAPKLAARITSSPLAQRGAMLMVAGTVKSPVAKALLGKFQGKGIERMIDAAVKESGRNITQGTIVMSVKEVEKIVADNIAKFIVRLGVGGTLTFAKKKLLEGGKKSPVVEITKSKAMRSKKKVDEAGLADLIMRDLERDPVVFQIYEDLCKSKKSTLESLIEADLKTAIDAKIKAAR